MIAVRDHAALVNEGPGHMVLVGEAGRRHGSRHDRSYVPTIQPERPLPPVVMLHGCTRTPVDFAIGTGMNLLAELFGCPSAWPAKPQRADVQKCRNWFRPEDQVRDRGEPALIAGINGDILRDHPADPARVYVAGLSAGGAAAAIMATAIMATACPGLFAAVGVDSALPVDGFRRDCATSSFEGTVPKFGR